MKIRDVLKENLRLARIVWIIRKLCSNQGFLPGPTRASGKLGADTISSWSYDMEGHAKKCVERYCEQNNSTIIQQSRDAMHGMTIHLKKKKMSQ